jgi:hypothetical protein
MKRLSTIIIFSVCAAVWSSCARQTVEIGSLTDADWRAMHETVTKLCAAYKDTGERDEDGQPPALRGANIPESLRYLRPQRVWIVSGSATIELWHTPAGDDTIYFSRDDHGIWTITVHEGSYVNKERVVWKSKNEPNKAPVPTATSVTPAADAPVAPAAAAAHL